MKQSEFKRLKSGNVCRISLGISNCVIVRVDVVLRSFSYNNTEHRDFVDCTVLYDDDPNVFSRCAPGDLWTLYSNQTIEILDD